MNLEDQHKLKRIVLEEIHKQKYLIAKLSETTKPISPDNSIGRLTRMETINDKSVSDATLNSARHKLVELENTLVKIDQPGFGLCIKCENHIPLNRIMLMPQNPYCVSCAEKIRRQPR